MIRTKDPRDAPIMKSPECRVKLECTKWLCLIKVSHHLIDNIFMSGSLHALFKHTLDSNVKRLCKPSDISRHKQDDDV